MNTEINVEEQIDKIWSVLEKVSMQLEAAIENQLLLGKAILKIKEDLYGKDNRRNTEDTIS